MLRKGAPSPGTVLVVDDEESVGRLVRRHLPGWTVLQAFSLGLAAPHLEGATDLRLVLLDLNLADTTYPDPLLDNPFQGSFELARRIRHDRPTLPVVIFTGHINGAIANAANQVGAELISKHDPATTLDLLHRRLELAHPSATCHSLPYLGWLRDHRGMTPRESDVAALAIQGITSYADIGDRLGISPNTVKRHVTSLLDRAGADSLLDFILRAHNIHR
jgi:DNA-binding NarL/FixJ family response regulator